MVASVDLDRPVWYAAYGSNLLRARFMTYLEGGPVEQAGLDSGSGPVETGARDASSPMDSRPLRLPGWQLIFAGRSRRWNEGGVCAVLPAAAEVLGRGWLITLGQLADVWVQENAGTVADIEVIAAAVERGEGVEIETGAYSRLAAVGELEGVPMMTITGTEDAMSRLNVPDPAYRAVVAAGLSETWGFTDGEIDAYLAGCLGARPAI